ncbi:MAG: ComF family protein [Planctomycetes bacterium]|nr:ComF family protein [Planctomycetota bacterium]
MARTDPTRIVGRWREGFALDFHVVSSMYVGDDEFGHPRFDTKRSELGELLYRLKYQSDVSAIREIALAASEFVQGWNKNVEAIVPIPPTRAGRAHQPVLLVSKALGGALGLPVFEDALIKVRETPELKDVFDYNERLNLLDGAFSVEPSQVRGLRLLLLDDLYRSGATMNAAASALYDQGGAADVYALALTRTRRRG